MEILDRPGRRRRTGAAQLYTHTLKLLGVDTVLTAEDGAEALSQVKLANGKVDVIVTDLDMPTVGGLEFVRRLRENPDTKIATIPVVVVSNFRDAAVVREAVDLNIQGFLVKPITEAVLRSRIAKALGRSGQAAAAN